MISSTIFFSFQWYLIMAFHKLNILPPGIRCFHTHTRTTSFITYLDTWDSRHLAFDLLICSTLKRFNLFANKSHIPCNISHKVYYNDAIVSSTQRVLPLSAYRCRSDTGTLPGVRPTSLALGRTVSAYLRRASKAPSLYERDEKLDRRRKVFQTCLGWE